MVAKYQIIKDDIVQKIREGVFLPGDKIYSEAELRKKYDVSNTTVVKALNNLVSDGYLIRKQGLGTYVRRNLIDRKVLFSETSPVSSMKGRIVERTETKVSDPFKDKEIAKKLGDKSGLANLIQVVQIAYVNDTPWKLQNRYLLERKMTKAGIENIRQGGSVTRELTTSYNLHTDMSINIVLCDRDSEELKSIAAHLQEKYAEHEKVAFFDIQKTTTNLEGEILEYTRSFIDPKFYSIQISTE